MPNLSRTLSIYVGWHFIMSFAGLFGGISGLILLFDIVELLRRTAGHAEIGMTAILGLALLKLPHTAQATLPFIVMLAMMYALFRLSRSYELMVIRAAGWSVWQFLAPPLVLALGLGAVNLAVVDPFASSLYETYQRLEDDMIRHVTTTMDLGKNGLWLREAKDKDATVVYAAQVRQEDNVLILGGVTIFKTENEKLTQRFEAANGQLVEGFLKLDDVWDFQQASRGWAGIYYAEYFLPTALTSDRVQDSFAAPDTMSFWELPGFIRASRAAGFSAIPHRLYWQSLLASPFLLCAMVLVASVFYLTVNARLAGWTLRGAAGITTGFLLYFFNRFTFALGLSSTLPLSLAAWAPTVVTTLLGVAYLFHREDG